MATPSPQQVGREFVRQYYTVLHEAPDVLHRFYSSGSTFVHGGVDRPGLTEEPVTGQLEIDKKIKLLNFKDCHTKIRQVDSQSTIGNGVVVQVTGELSNNGEPMRRFMQTFVLAPQTPKKYYVHNDIFRYQDEVYQDNSDTESEDPQQTEATLNNKSNNNTTPVNSNLNMNYYQGANEQQLETNEVNVVINNQTMNAANNALASSLSTSVTSSSSSSSATVSTSPSSQVVLQQQEHAVSQNVEIIEQQAVVNENATANSTIVNGHGSGAEPVCQLEEASVTVETSESVREKPVETKNSTSSTVSGKEELKQETAQNTETKSSTGHSWAKIISTGQSTSSMSSLEQNTLTGTNSQIYQQNQPNPTNTSNSVSSQQKRVNGNSSNNYNNNSVTKGQTNKPRNQQQQQQQTISQPAQQQTQQPAQQQQQQQQPQSQQQTQQRQTDANSLDDEKRFGRYPDGQQVFVGNLNQDLSEEDLKSFFNKFGKVIDVRINTNSKQQSGRRLPNYGFVVFDDKQSVENLLSASKANSLTLKNEKGEYRLNVEEKRARQGRMSSGFGNGGGKGNRVTRSSSNGSRNAPNGHGNTSQKKNTNYSQLNENNNNGPVGGSNGGNGFIERRKTDVHENQMNENGSQRKSNIRRS